MSAKKRKGQSPWSTCDCCSVIIAQKDALLHREKSCPPNLQSWIHSFIYDEKLYSTIYTFQLQDKNLELISKENRSDFILIPYHVLQLCKIPLGDPVVIIPHNNQSVSFVKFAWPVQEKTPDFSVALSNEALELNNLELKSHLIVSKIQEKISSAKVIKLACQNEVDSYDKRKLLSRIQKQNTGKVFCIGNKLLLKHYGNRLLFTVVNVSYENMDTLNANKFYLVTFETKWQLDSSKEEQAISRNLISKLGGLNSVIDELSDVISLALSGKNEFSGLFITKGILIYGPPGTGKTKLIEALAESFSNNIIKIITSELLSKFVGDIEEELKNSFEKAKELKPSIILLDDLDVLCAKSNSTTEFEKRITAFLSCLMEKLNSDNDASVVVLATTSKIDQIDKILRCTNRFGKEAEIYVPNRVQRFQILNILLSQVNHSLMEADVKNIADFSLGFVGADLASVISKAVLRNYKMSQGKDKVSLNDFHWAMSKVKPSAMKEIMIEVPNVKWNDIGGQEELKLKLKQSVEWPLKYGEAFEKLGITPPKGVLMFGPPGCSKTMIAKAIATESKLNFISVKGPELFSKWVGESEKAVRDIFRRARLASPSIIFFDEIDAIGGERNISSSSNVQERVLAQLLTELDGVETLENVTVVAATNRPDRIDPALLRPGRLDRIIYVPLPDHKTRQEIFALQLQRTCVSEDVYIEELVYKSEGYSGAEIIAVCREAALNALEENIDTKVVMRKHFLGAFKIVIPRTSKSLLEMYDKYLMK